MGNGLSGCFFFFSSRRRHTISKRDWISDVCSSDLTEPIYFVDGVLHYCVSNMPAAVPHTSTLALTNATFPYLLELANHGLEGACDRNAGLCEGVNTYNGYVTHAGVAESPGREWRELA